MSDDKSNSAAEKAKVVFPDGCFPTMITPMNNDGSINYPRLKALTEWYIQSGCTGLFANCLSSEMFHLTEDERVEITRVVREKSAGRVTVVSSGGLNCASIKDQAAFVRRIAEHCDAVVIVANQLVSSVDDSDDTWKENAQTLLELTDDIPLGLYECPKPFHYLLSPSLLTWAASTGRFYFHKDTCCNTKEIKAKIAGLATLPKNIPFKFYNANIATLLMSIREGGNGFSGISANFYPHVLVWLAKNTDHKESDFIQALISVAENVVADQYPVSAKLYQSLFDGFEGSTFSRTMDNTLVEEAELKVTALHQLMDFHADRLGITRFNPATFLE